MIVDQIRQTEERVRIKLIQLENLTYFFKKKKL